MNCKMENAHQIITNELDVLYNATATNYNQSTLPHLLTEYGLTDLHQEAVQGKQKKDAEKECSRTKRKHITTSNSFISAQDEKVRKRQTEKEEYYLKLVQDMYRLRDHYYKEYIRRLSQKVRKQQEEIKEKDNQSKEKREQKEEEKKKANQKMKKLEHKPLELSSTAKEFPKTDLYYIVGLQQKLLREGKLKTMTDYNTFRLRIQDPQVFYTNFKVQKSSDKHSNNEGLIISDASTVLKCSSHHESNNDRHNSAGFILPCTTKLPYYHHPSQTMQSLSHITKLRKPSRLNNWANAQQYPSQPKKCASVPGFLINKSKQDVQLDLDKRFPKVVMPKLHCFDMNLTSKPPDLDQVEQTAELRAKEKLRKRMMREVAKMYQLAMSNVATSARILDQHEDINLMFDGPDLCDVIADNHWIEAFQLKDSGVTKEVDNQKIFDQLLEEITEEPESNDMELIKELAEVKAVKKLEKSEISLSQISSSESNSDFTSSDSEMEFHKSSSKSKILSTVDKIPQPLTMDEIRDKYNIVESKSLSTFWMNYMGAGK